MPRKPKKTFRAAREARSVAREVIGTPPPVRVIENKRSRPPKHKKPLLDSTEQ
jgi:hypothetical protein